MELMNIKLDIQHQVGGQKRLVVHSVHVKDKALVD